jgi:photosystem II stability/assembly factor-like uncharacterized protein
MQPIRRMRAFRPHYTLCSLLAAFSLVHLWGCCTHVRPLQPNIALGGRAIAIAVSPGSDQILLVASESGGLFGSKDGGLTWKHVDGLPSHRLRDVAFAPGRSDVVFATASEDFRNTSTGGIWRSQDGGVTWSQPVGSRPESGPRCRDRLSAHGISFEPDIAKLYVGTDCGLSMSSDLGVTWLHAQPDPSAPVDIQKKQNLVQAVLALRNGRVHLAAEDAIWSSRDGGTTWARSASFGPAQGDVHALAASPYNADHLFLATRSNLYFSSDAGATWTLSTTGDGNRPPFVRTARSVSGRAGEFDVYFGTGVRLLRGSYADGPTPQVVASWTQVGVDHADPADVGIGADGSTPLLLATDGGVHRTADKGANWTITGGGTGGYNALQITEVTGQLVGGASPHTDLYFGTQDNLVWASADGGASWPWKRCCEGFYLRTERRTVDHGNAHVSGVACAPCGNFLCAAHLQSCRGFPSPPDGDGTAGDEGEGVPFPVRPGSYVYRVVNNDTDLTESILMLTNDAGASWTRRATFHEEPLGRPIVSGDPPVIYLPVRRPGLARGGLLRIGLIRIDNVLGPGDATVRDAGGTGLGSLGYFPTMFAWYPVFGVDPRDPDYLIAPDFEAGDMKVSRDGGSNWGVDQPLTDAVTSDGSYRLYLDGRRPTVAAGIGSFVLVSAIEFNPDNPCHILVGTVENGAFRSTNGGATWSKVKGSSRIPQLSSFFFRDNRTALASSYGRGLWELRFWSFARRCVARLQDLGPVQVEPPAIYDPVTAAKTPFKALGTPDPCKGACRYLVLRHGEITGLELKGMQVRGVSVSGGMTAVLNAAGKEEEFGLPLKVEVAPSPSPGGELLERIRRNRASIRGLVLEGTLLRGIIAAGGELPSVPWPSDPYVSLYAQTMVGAERVVSAGQQVSVLGRGFVPTDSGPNAVRVSLDGQLVSDLVSVGKDGRFRVALKAPVAIGEYVVEVVQQTPARLLVDRSFFRVVAQDLPVK